MNKVKLKQYAQTLEENDCDSRACKKPVVRPEREPLVGQSLLVGQPNTAAIRQSIKILMQRQLAGMMPVYGMSLPTVNTETSQEDIDNGIVRVNITIPCEPLDIVTVKLDDDKEGR
jgi:hypothetical protein